MQNLDKLNITEKKKNRSQEIKAWTLSLITIFQATFFAITIKATLQRASTLNVDMWDAYRLIVQTFLLIYSYAVLVITTTKKSILFGLLPIPIGITLAHTDTFYEYEIIIFTVSLAIMFIGVYKTRKLANLLIKPLPRLTLRYTAYALLLVYSIIMSTYALLFYGAIKEQNIDIVDITATYVTNTIENNTPKISDTLYNIGISPNVVDQIKTGIGIGDRNKLQNKIKTLIQPYKDIALPVLVTALYSLMRVYSVIVLVLFDITIGDILRLCKAIKLVKTGKFKVTQETLEL